MNVLDYLLLIPLLYGLYSGFSKGMFRQVAGIAGIVLGVVFSYKCVPPIHNFFVRQGIENGTLLTFLSYVLAFLFILFSVFIAGRLLRQLSKMIGLGGIEKLLGILLGIIKFYVISVLVLFVFLKLNQKWEMVEQKTFNQSKLYPYYEPSVLQLESYWNQM